MPVSLLLCEGGPNSPDVRVLKKLLAGRCEIRPMGGKYGMGERIAARRETLGATAVFGLLDGDFHPSWSGCEARPRPWPTADKITVFGWRWERKEIENYLIDPSLVSRALGEAALAETAYVEALGGARDRIAVYQAARTALSLCRPRFQPLASSFGPPRGRDRHPFPDGAKLDEAGCRDGIRAATAEYCDGQLIDAQTALDRFDQLLPEFRHGGARHRDFLSTFSGKDLLLTLDAALRRFGFASAGAFREKLLLALEHSVEDVGLWLPEWKALQQVVDAQ